MKIPHVAAALKILAPALLSILAAMKYVTQETLSHKYTQFQGPTQQYQ